MQPREVKKLTNKELLDKFGAVSATVAFLERAYVVCEQNHGRKIADASVQAMQDEKLLRAEILRRFEGAETSA